jgi:ubiquinone/menaquinone biosynthesis C-methylase UbiE
MREDSGRKIFEKIIQHGDVKDQEILEIGCGDGRITTLLAGRPKKFVAIDPDEKVIQAARSSIKDVDFQVGSGEKTSFPDNCFDVVVFTLSLHHQNSQKALKEAGRILKEDGRILVIEPVIEGELERLFCLLHDEDREKREAQKAIATSGLYLIESETFTAKWIFENQEDLVESTFGYYEMPFDSGIAAEMRSLLGDKIEMPPIAVTDLMRIQSLKKQKPYSR